MPNMVSVQSDRKMHQIWPGHDERPVVPTHHVSHPDSSL